MHDRRVKLNNAIKVREAPIPYRRIVRVPFDDVHTLDDGIQRVTASAHHLHGLGHRRPTIRASHRGGRHSLGEDGWSTAQLGYRNHAKGGSSSYAGRGSEKIAAGGHTWLLAYAAAVGTGPKPLRSQAPGEDGRVL
jgi:hypothetical protein